MIPRPFLQETNMDQEIKDLLANGCSPEEVADIMGKSLDYVLDIFEALYE